MPRDYFLAKVGRDAFVFTLFAILHVEDHSLDWIPPIVERRPLLAIIFHQFILLVVAALREVVALDRRHGYKCWHRWFIRILGAMHGS